MDENEVYKRINELRIEINDLKEEVRSLKGQVNSFKNQIDALSILNNDADDSSIENRVKDIICKHENRIQAVREVRRTFNLTLKQSDDLVKKFM